MKVLLYRLVCSLILFLLCISWIRPVAAQTNKWINPVFLINGKEIWPLAKQIPGENFQMLWKDVSNRSLAATWFFRYDALEEDAIYTTARLFPDNQERGLYLEVTPQLARDADVSQKTGPVLSANRLLLSGYPMHDRRKLIDASMSKFLTIFGHFPVSVAFWHIDPESARYLQEHYGVKVLMLLANQDTNPNIRVEGNWWGVPYYPSRFNLLIPASDLDFKLPLVVMQLPQKLLSPEYIRKQQALAANIIEVPKKGLSSDLFESYLHPSEGDFSQITVSWENSFDSVLFRDDLTEQFELTTKAAEQQMKVATLEEFADWYRNTFKEISPGATLMTNEDGSKVSWEMTNKYRMAWKENVNGIEIFDYRTYNQRLPDPYFQTPNPFSTLNEVVPAEIDGLIDQNEVVQISKEELELIRQNAGIKLNSLPFEYNKSSVFIFWIGLFLVILILYRKQPVLSWLLMVGTLVLSLPMMKSGILYSYGMGFWGANSHDAVWHIALIEHFAKNWNFNSPLLLGVKLENYHFLFDILAAVIHKLTRIPVLNLYFQFLPPVMALALGWMSYSFSLAWSKSKTASYLALIFVYFGSSWGWIVNLVRSGTLDGESMFWATQSVSTLINPPFALSLIILLACMRLFLVYQKRQSFRILICLAGLSALLVQAKVYAAVLVVSGYGMMSLIEIAKHVLHKNKQEGITFHNFKSSLLFGLTLVLAIILFLLTSGNGTGFLVFSPLWFTHTMLAASDRLNWEQLEQARLAYWATGRWFKALTIESIAIAFFFLGNIGPRIIGVVWICRSIWLWSKGKFHALPIDVILITMTLASMLIPLIWIQKGVAWNTIQFIYYGLVFLGLFSARFIGEWLDALGKPWVTRAIILVVLVVNLPTTFGTLPSYLSSPAPARVPYEELSVLEMLKKQPEGLVLTYPFDYKRAGRYYGPQPLPSLISTGYVSALTGKPVFLEDEINLEITGADWKKQRKLAEGFFNAKKLLQARKFIEENQIKYIYVLNEQPLPFDFRVLGLKKLFDNGLAIVYEKV